MHIKTNKGMPSIMLRVMIATFLFAAIVILCSSTHAADRLSNKPGSTASPQKVKSLVNTSDANLIVDRITFLEKQLKTALELKDEHTENLYTLVRLLSIFTGIILFFLVVRETINRRHEYRRMEKLDNRDQERTDIVNEGLGSVNKVIETVNNTLEHRLILEKKFDDYEEKMKNMQDQLDAVTNRDKPRYEEAVIIAEEFLQHNRMEFSNMSVVMANRGDKLIGEVNSIRSYIINKSDFIARGKLYYVCGVLSFYKNDISGAKEYLDLMHQLVNDRDHAKYLSSDETYRKRFAFMYFFRALIAKSWGELNVALKEIEQSKALLEVEIEADKEYLSPVTEVEIQSYKLSMAEKCQAVAEQLLKKISRRTKLDKNQMKLRTRLYLIYGNTYYIEKKYEDALKIYEEAYDNDPLNYYVMFSIAQCMEKLGNKESACEMYAKCLNTLEENQVVSNKQEMITKAVIATIGAISASQCTDRNLVTKYAKVAKKLLTSTQMVNGMTPKFFSPTNKLLVSSENLLSEVQNLVS